jgi:glutamate 5-kinase
VTGSFRKGDVITLTNADGEEFARGLTNYSSEDASRICGLRSDQIGMVLGTQPYEEVVHRDNLVVIM